MRVDTIEFRGITFRRYPDSAHREARLYYVPNGKHRAEGVARLHQEIWKASHGPIPEGHHIHHKDGNPLNNALNNLDCVPIWQHLSDHARTPEMREQARKNIEVARPFAALWHSSDEGRAWHREHGVRAWGGREPIERVCEQCGSRFGDMARRSNTRFCSPKCKAKWRRDSGVDDVQRRCERCGVDFTTNKYSKARFCSTSCGKRKP